ncbi:MAG: phenylacetate-CoA oxygenase subunit PaaI [Acidobacteriota bacterium]|nr:phenylacetate-CoA oxygenase subunit PaaI [Acidobacteriota bacterium]
MSTSTTELPARFHNAVVKWRQTFIPDFELLLERWEKFFPEEPAFRLCAFRELGMCDRIECGDAEGAPKFNSAGKMHPGQAGHLLGAIQAQASTEFGSIQQHQLTLARAQEEDEQFWILRMMAEELRHGYQMLHLLVEDDWTSVSDLSSDDMVEQILSMRTGSHILGAFNVDFDSFVDNATFCALIDRVGKYQLSMQKISAYKPMAESMPQMLREEAFHLMAGVLPLRRWMEKAGGGSLYTTTADIQKAINKWLPRGLEMFGDERGGGTNVRFGLKPMKNAEAQSQYLEEVKKVIRGLNLRFVRARLPELDRVEAETLLDRIIDDRQAKRGISYEDLVHAPDPSFFRRRGVPAFELTGWDGEEFSAVENYVKHLSVHLPDAYRAGRDFKHYVETLRRVHEDELTVKEASRAMPSLSRVGGVCPCSRAVRWVADEEPS